MVRRFLLVRGGGSVWPEIPGSITSEKGGSVYSEILNNVLYGRYESANYKLYLAKIDEADPNLSFAIAGVTDVKCIAVTDTKRTLTFTPQYTGLTGQPVTFSVFNELVPTNSPGPYTLNLYTDNPTITLKATQIGTIGEASYKFNWMAACGGARQAAIELQAELNIVVMPNPTSDQIVDVEVRGAAAQPVNYQVIDEQGKPISQLRIEQADTVERQPLRLGSLPGTYLIKVNVSDQTKTVKVLKK